VPAISKTGPTWANSSTEGSKSTLRTSLDLHSRGGRLSADIQAVVAADYIRNLREETRKGFYGRLKQGFYPLPAPLGYIDRGKGKCKDPDPVKAPLVRKAFELYSTGQFNLYSLLDEIHRLGLRNKGGGKVTRTGVSVMLNNPFYIGLIRLRRTGETFAGAHEPLISKQLFDRVQRILNDRTPTRTILHAFVFRRLLRCKSCGYSLIGERQKGHVYYRCHTNGCSTKSIREEAIEQAIAAVLPPLQFTDDEREYLEQRVTELREHWVTEKEEQIQTLTLRLGNLQERVGRLTDVYIDGAIEKDLFQERKAAVLLERKDAEERLGALKGGRFSLPDRLAEFLELAESVSGSYKTALSEEKRDLLKIVTSNREVDGKNVVLTLTQPFALIAQRCENSHGAPYRDTPRTLDSLLHNLSSWLKQNPTPQNPAATSDPDDNVDSQDSTKPTNEKTAKFAA
jgi:site-specific DNA recombinase